MGIERTSHLNPPSPCACPPALGRRRELEGGVHCAPSPRPSPSRGEGVSDDEGVLAAAFRALIPGAMLFVPMLFAKTPGTPRSKENFDELFTRIDAGESPDEIWKNFRFNDGIQRFNGAIAIVDHLLEEGRPRAAFNFYVGRALFSYRSNEDFSEAGGRAARAMLEKAAEMELHGDPLAFEIYKSLHLFLMNASSMEGSDMWDTMDKHLGEGLRPLLEFACTRGCLFGMMFANDRPDAVDPNEFAQQIFLKGVPNEYFVRGAERLLERYPQLQKMDLLERTNITQAFWDAYIEYSGDLGPSIGHNLWGGFMNFLDDSPTIVEDILSGKQTVAELTVMQKFLHACYDWKNVFKRVQGSYNAVVSYASKAGTFAATGRAETASTFWEKAFIRLSGMPVSVLQDDARRLLLDKWLGTMQRKVSNTKDVKFPGEIGPILERITEAEPPNSPIRELIAGVKGRPAWRAVNDIFGFMESRKHELSEKSMRKLGKIAEKIARTETMRRARERKL